MSPRGTLRRKLKKNAVGVLGLVLVLMIVFASLAAPVLAPYAPTKMYLSHRMEAPSSAFVLGTDNFGRDVLSRILYGYRVSLLIAIASVAISLIVGTAIGLVAGYYGGLSDAILMRVMDILLAMPIILLAIAVIAILGTGLYPVIAAIAIGYIPNFARLIRGSVLSLRNEQFVEAARACGSSDVRIIIKHILPNMVSPILVQLTLNLSTAIIVESALSFLGLGTQPPMPSLGQMLSESRNFMQLSPWTAVFSGGAIFVAVMGFNVLGDGLRDILDPKSR